MKKFIPTVAILLMMVANVGAACSVPEALEYQWGAVAGTTNGEITAWGHQTEPQPSKAQIDSAVVTCSKEKLRAEKIVESKAYAESLWQDDFPGVTFGMVKLAKESLLSVDAGSRTLTPAMQLLTDQWQAGAADGVVLNNYTGLGAISAHDPTGWWP